MTPTTHPNQKEAAPMPPLLIRVLVAIVRRLPRRVLEQATATKLRVY